MKAAKVFALAAATAAGLCVAVNPPQSQAQVSVSIGAAPACPYGYYATAPYGCAPYGYYGPEWFTGGVFIGAGPWYHGRSDFYGHVDTHYHPDYGYHGPYPARGEHPNPAYHPDHNENFHGNAMHDPQGHAHEDHGHH
jgi:hypothetical protein